MDTEHLREWYRDQERQLPWREPGVSAWAITVSEFMLQQTPVARVVPAWIEWCERWPEAKNVAAASLGDVLQQWGRLGYPRRAKHLHQLAQIIASDYGGQPPADVDTLESLPGIGPYTARAIACFAYDQPVPVVDTNVKRVVARAVHGTEGAGHWSTREGLVLVDQAVGHQMSDADYCLSQRALMELGALVCTARSPRCDACPLQAHCQWRLEGYPSSPSTRPRKQPKYEGSDRYVRGIILAALRDEPSPIDKEDVASLWALRGQFERALESLVSDGLVLREESDSGAVLLSLPWQPPGRAE